MAADQHRAFRAAQQGQHLLQPCGVRPCARDWSVAPVKGAFRAPSIFGKRREHDIYRQRQVYGTGVASGGRTPSAVDEFADPRAVGDLHRVLCQGRGDGNIIDFLEAAGTLPLKRRRSRHENDRRALAPSFKHGGYGVGKTFGPDKADRRFARNPCMPIRQMPRDLFVRAIDDGHLAFHEALKRGIAKAPCKREDMLHTLFLERACQ